MSILNLKAGLFQLPSMGIGYEDVLNLINKDSIKIRPFVAGDQKVISARGQDPFKTYASLLDKIIVEPKINVGSLLISDANAILFAVRAMSLGSDYNISYKCANCDSQENFEVDLLSTEVKYADEIENFNPSENTFTTQNNDVIVYRLPRLEDETFVTSIINNIKRRGAKPSDMDSVFVRLSKLITKINKDEIELYTKALKFLETLPMGDFQDFVEDSVKRDTGLVTDLTVECSSCGWENEVRLAMTAEFFRPRAKRSQDTN